MSAKKKKSPIYDLCRQPARSQRGRRPLHEGHRRPDRNGDVVGESRRGTEVKCIRARCFLNTYSCPEWCNNADGIEEPPRVQPVNNKEPTADSLFKSPALRSVVGASSGTGAWRCAGASRVTSCCGTCSATLSSRGSPVTQVPASLPESSTNPQSLQALKAQCVKNLG